MDADLVVGAVLVPGADAPKLITADMVKKMKPGSVIVDVAIDQGGCAAETLRATTTTPTRPTWSTTSCTTASPTCPAPWRRTSTFALNNATLPFTLALADKGY